MTYLIALLVVACGAVGVYKLGRANAPSPGGVAVVTTGPTSSLPTPTLAAPFRGTPAQAYADGAAGIVVPPAKPAGRYSAAQVAAAYQKSKQLLVAADLTSPR